jgi:hypothetical protein
VEAGDGNIWGSVGIAFNRIEDGICDLVGSGVLPIDTRGKPKLDGTRGPFS